jgi:mannose-6-phosphate isomerase-like protein (cupin superfamily)
MPSPRPLPKHRFAVSRRKESPFRPGFRSYFVDRDLGVREATGGAFMAEVHRAAAPCPKDGTGTHLHELSFQFNYMLKGWCRMQFEGEGVFTFEEGDTWLQPPAIKHNFLECSADCEILEICSPGNFRTVDA